MPPNPELPLPTPAELGPPHLCSPNFLSTGTSQCLHFLFQNNSRLLEKLQKESKEFLSTSVSHLFLMTPQEAFRYIYFSLIAFCHEILIPQILYTCLWTLCISELYMEKE